MNRQLKASLGVILPRSTVPEVEAIEKMTGRDLSHWK
jgi:hypothetical protein